MTVHLGFFSFHQPRSRCSLSRLFEKILKDVLCDRWSHGLNNQIGGRGKSAFGGGKQAWRWAGVPGCETWGLGTGAMDEAHAHQPCVPDTQALQESQFLTFPCQVHFLPEHGAEWGDWEVPATASCPDLSWEKKTSPPRSTRHLHRLLPASRHLTWGEGSEWAHLTPLPILPLKPDIFTQRWQKTPQQRQNPTIFTYQGAQTLYFYTVGRIKKSPTKQKNNPKPYSFSTTGAKTAVL